MDKSVEKTKKVFGLIMPISAIEDCDENHWRKIREIVEEAVDEYGAKIRMVSEKEDSGIIQKSIVQAIYDDELIICDVSCKNPNVLFELGMRLAFDKPVVIIYDGIGKYPFDITNIKYVSYPRGLDYCEIKKFKESLKKMIEKTLKETDNTFLKTFGTFTTYKAKEETVELKESEKMVLDKLEEINKKLFLLEEKKKNIKDNDLRRIEMAKKSELEAQIRKMFFCNLINEKKNKIEKEEFEEIIDK